MPTTLNPSRPPGGKYNTRHCPALDGVITPADCGAKRGSKLDCPDDCPFFPFARAGFDLWVKVDNAWTAKALEYVERHMKLARFQEIVQRQRIPMPSEQLELECAVQNALYTVLFIQRDAAGSTLAQKWESENWAGLNNDEQVMMRCRLRGRPTVIEVQRIVDAWCVECLDVLDPAAGPFRVLDRGLAARMVRFSRILTWLIPYPHFSRVSASAIEMPYALWPEWRATVEQRHQTARETRPDLTLKDFLAETIVETTMLVGELNDAHRARMLASLDVEHCLTLFRYTCPRADLERVFDAKPDFERIDEGERSHADRTLVAYNWVGRGESATLAQGTRGDAAAGTDSSAESVPVFGTARLFEGLVAFDTFSKRKQAFLRQIVERDFGSLLAFERETVKSLAAIMDERQRRGRILAFAEHLAFGDAAQAAPAAADPAPQNPDAAQKALAEQHLRDYRGFLDAGIAALDGLSPRAAAADPEKRPRLIELMKQHLVILEQRNRDQGLNLTLDWALEELGLRELL
ncbi:MAG: hypothetical protein KA191_05620 [Verrucomicrobia bacterium]|jgi:hypothetical protein|nr:hypothetical protein [Verrucomicrobiota bacterium]OQC63769.1 MAG: hypothetical protein BWX48_03076 [Verrucomicrobia bacterium ADurb.Bin006]MDI9381769.1 hypothetical protein [Verrucomicrobiota bacterium]NMD19492.1 hypothetical protein [Verrucomicrobiota bacterium]HNV00650.1 hypothetical protein [Verrucomicrobiota bacterium]